MSCDYDPLSRHIACDGSFMDATHLHCPRCAGIQPVRFQALLPGEPGLGTSVYCARCRHLAFTLIRPARFYCEICDEVQPALVERVDEGRDRLGVQLICGGCFDGKSLLYAVTDRSDGASAPQPQPLRGDRARRE